MEITLEVPDYTDNGIKYNWQEGFEISIQSDESVVKIKANKQGLISLANHLLNLAQEAIPAGFHMHFDKHNCLADTSAEIIIEKE